MRCCVRSHASLRFSQGSETTNLFNTLTHTHTHTRTQGQVLDRQHRNQAARNPKAKDRQGLKRPTSLRFNTHSHHTRTMTLTSPSNPLLSHPATPASLSSTTDSTSQQTPSSPSPTTIPYSSSSADYHPASVPPSLLPTEATSTTALKADFSVTLQSESTTKLNSTFQRLMDTIHATPGLAIRGPIRLPKDGKLHSRRVDIKSITERSLRDIGTRSGILLSEDAGDERIQENGVVVSFDIE
ncbi:MAG: hypothetical protein JOS17DRAFT_734471 [Linnemannia elongata]|nr:MAG: hypothetical protein JOS17DRAFT_734471 [Linnemannia elongata]